MAATGEYRRLEDPEEDSPPGEEEMLLHVPEGLPDSWYHVKNLDDFFSRIYRFHQRNGFACMVLADAFELGQFAFVVAFTTFLLCCVDYDVLFANRPLNHSRAGDRPKVTLPDALLPVAQCAQRIQGSGWIIFLLAMATVFWLYRLVKVLCSLLNYWEIRSFYTKALNIPSEELCSLSWQEVQARLMELQRRQPLCVHKRELTELDIYHRILRFKNYAVAMVNKSLLPVRFRLPLLGSVVFLTRGLQYNLELLLFWGPGSLFQNKWSLRARCKRAEARRELARSLARAAVLAGLANLALCPCVLLWQLLYAFFSYAEGIKREPGSLGTRRWSLYGRLYLRHFNELEHELQARLSRGYRPATEYMNSFASPLLAVLAKNVGFFAGSILAVLIALTVYDEDVLAVEHVLAAATLLGVVVTVARSFIPDEHAVRCPQQLLQRVLAHVHYMPDHWPSNAGRSETRSEMGQLFQYKAVFILEELLSPIVTPLILIFALPARALDIVDFFRNFTVEVAGVGDVCSFAQLDVRNHGNPQWLSAGQTEASVYQQAEDGKTELSLMHFTITNPRWQPPPPSELFLSHLKEQAQRDAAAVRPPGTTCPSDEVSVTSPVSPWPHGAASGILAWPAVPAGAMVATDHGFGIASGTASLLASLVASQRAWGPLGDGGNLRPQESAAPPLLLCEAAQAEMSLHAIYMHELHQQQQQQSPQDAAPQPAGTPLLLPITTGLARAPLGGWAEEEEEEEEETAT